MPRKKGPLDEFGRFDDHDPIARLIVHYFYPTDFLYREYLRLNRALAAQKKRTRWRSSQEFCYLRLWLAALFTVAEGFQELRLQNQEIETLLAVDHLNSLRLFRNGTFHYQKKPMKLAQFFRDDSGITSDRLAWAKLLHAAFAHFQSDYLVEITVKNALAAWQPKEEMSEP
jgi:hypothetical protein